MLLSLRSQANIHGRPTDESSISSKSAVHFLKMIHLRDFAPFICFSFSEWRILFLLFSDFANSTMESSPTKYPTEAQDATRWTHGYGYNAIIISIKSLLTFFAIISAIAQFLDFISLLSILHTFAIDNCSTWHFDWSLSLISWHLVSLQGWSRAGALLLGVLLHVLSADHPAWLALPHTGNRTRPGSSTLPLLPLLLRPLRRQAELCAGLLSH